MRVRDDRLPVVGDREDHRAGYAARELALERLPGPLVNEEPRGDLGKTSASWELIRSGSRMATAPMGLASGFPRAKRGAPALTRMH